MTDQEKDFIRDAAAGAQNAGHPFPVMAACEAALESGYGGSELARKAYNLFGMKQHAHPQFGTLALPTKEFLDHKWIAVTAEWVRYPDLKSCFADRLNTLQRLANAYPHYAAALRAKDATTFVTEVSRSWSTDPERAKKVLAIYSQFNSQGASA